MGVPGELVRVIIAGTETDHLGGVHYAIQAVVVVLALFMVRNGALSIIH